MVEPALLVERSLQRILARMAERRMADVVRQAQRLGQVLVQPQRPRDRAADLRDLQAMGQADAEMVAIGGHEDWVLWRSRRKLIEWMMRSRSR